MSQRPAYIGHILHSLRNLISPSQYGAQIVLSRVEGHNAISDRFVFQGGKWEKVQYHSIGSLLPHRRPFSEMSVTACDTAETMKSIGKKEDEHLPKDFKFNEDEFWKTANERLLRDGYPRIRYVRKRPYLQGHYTLIEVASSEVDARMCRNVTDAETNKVSSEIRVLPQIHSFGLSRLSRRDMKHRNDDIGMFWAASRAVQNFRAECRAQFKEPLFSDVSKLW